jgi:TatD DNase family protein
MIGSSNGKKIISQIPKNRLLTETDGPYVQYLGKPARPENVKSVLIYLADYYKEPVPVVEALIRNNFSELIKRIRKEITF